MAGHHPFAALRAGITADPARAERLAAAERQVAEEQAAYDQTVAVLERARASTRAHLDLTGNDGAQLERYAALYLTTLQHSLEAMGSDLAALARTGARSIQLPLADLLPAPAPEHETAEPSAPVP